MLVPKAAIVQGPQGAAVWVLDANDVAQARPVQLDREVEKGWIVKSGLQAGERVVVDGVIRVRPGAKVKPVAAPPAPAAATPASAPQGAPPANASPAAPPAAPAPAGGGTRP